MPSSCPSVTAWCCFVLRDFEGFGIFLMARKTFFEP